MLLLLLFDAFTTLCSHLDTDIILHFVVCCCPSLRCWKSLSFDFLYFQPLRLFVSFVFVSWLAAFAVLLRSSFVLRSSSFVVRRSLFFVLRSLFRCSPSISHFAFTFIHCLYFHFYTLVHIVVVVLSMNLSLPHSKSLTVAQSLTAAQSLSHCLSVTFQRTNAPSLSLSHSLAQSLIQSLRCAVHCQRTTNERTTNERSLLFVRRSFVVLHSSFFVWFRLRRLASFGFVGSVGSFGRMPVSLVGWLVRSVERTARVEVNNQRTVNLNDTVRVHACRAFTRMFLRA